MKLNPAIFREYDIRGIAGVDLNPDFATKLGSAYAGLLREVRRVSDSAKLTVSVGRDCRISSAAYANALIEGLTSAGVDVLRLGECPTPLTYFSIFHLNLDGGIMVTGSHNPPEYNGFKLCLGKEAITRPQLIELFTRIERSGAKHHNRGVDCFVGTVSKHSISSEYVEFLVSRLQNCSTKRVVIDAGNGAASAVGPEVFRRLGASVIPLFCKSDGTFPNHHPDPTVPANMKALSEAVVAEAADFGIAFDGDADRLGVVDERGRIIFADELMIIFSRSLLRANPGATIISEVKSSRRLYQDIAEKGGIGVMWRTGHSLIRAKMQECGALLAGEMSGHIFFSDRYFGYDDAIYAAARLMEIACSTPGPVSSLISDLPESFSTPELRVPCFESHKLRLVDEVKRRLAGRFEMNCFDGLRIDFGDGWGLVRASNTEPMIVLRYEATTERRLHEIRELIQTTLNDSAQTIGLPPFIFGS